MPEVYENLMTALFSEIEDVASALHPLHTAVHGEDTAEAGELLLDLAETVGELRLTSYRLGEVLRSRPNGTPQA